MSNEVYGYLEFSKTSAEMSDADFAGKLELSTGIGFAPITKNELFNFPKDFEPKSCNRVFYFLIGDTPGNKNATYLIDNMDYVAEARIDLPKKGLERLDLLVDSIEIMIKSAKAKRLVIALTDSSQIEDTKTVKLADLKSVIASDCDVFSPPDCLYEIVLLPE